METVEFQNLSEKDQVLEIIHTINSNDMVNVLTYNNLTGISMSILEFIATEGETIMNAILQDDRVATVDYANIEGFSMDDETVLLAERDNIVIFTNKSDLTSTDIQNILKEISE